MSAQGAFRITEDFERELCRYTGAPYAVAVDNCSNALFLALVRYGIEGRTVRIPRHTYPSVPCAIIHAGGRVEWRDDGRTVAPAMLRGPYNLFGTPVVDSALRFTANQYRAGETQCLSFTGPHKTLKLGKGGAILTDSREDYEWYKRARFSGRGECSYLEDDFTMLGWNFYMPVETAARGLHLMAGFWKDGVPVSNPDLSFRFPDLSRFPIYAADRSKLLPFDGASAAHAAEVLHGYGAVGLWPRDTGARHTDHVGAQTATVTREEAPNAETRQAIEDSRAGLGVSYASADAMFAEMDKHDPRPVAVRGLLFDVDVRLSNPRPVIRCEVPPPAEPCPDYDAYRGNP